MRRARRGTHLSHEGGHLALVLAKEWRRARVVRVKRAHHGVDGHEPVLGVDHHVLRVAVVAPEAGQPVVVVNQNVKGERAPEHLQLLAARRRELASRAKHALAARRGGGGVEEGGDGEPLQRHARHKLHHKAGRDRGQHGRDGRRGALLERLGGVEPRERRLNGEPFLARGEHAAHLGRAHTQRGADEVAAVVSHHLGVGLDHHAALAGQQYKVDPA
mmetsp:Transcript_530/g.1665  ORF Transcript_530/g.1665 Transcript_530/m.1665 type:complete len:217 (+) Transcript_530:653-1303(+)